MSAYLVFGLVLFLGVHSARIVAADWRTAQVARMGELRWKGVYSLLSVAGPAPIIRGYGLARGVPVVLWLPPTWTRHLAALRTLPAFILPVWALFALRGHASLIGVGVFRAWAGMEIGSTSRAALPSRPPRGYFAWMLIR